MTNTTSNHCIYVYDDEHYDLHIDRRDCIYVYDDEHYDLHIDRHDCIYRSVSFPVHIIFGIFTTIIKIIVKIPEAQQ